jgi:hypothetical protein
MEAYICRLTSKLVIEKRISAVKKKIVRKFVIKAASAGSQTRAPKYDEYSITEVETYAMTYSPVNTACLGNSLEMILK